jgi:hypothetical protein
VRSPCVRGISTEKLCHVLPPDPTQSPPHPAPHPLPDTSIPHRNLLSLPCSLPNQDMTWNKNSHFLTKSTTSLWITGGRRRRASPPPRPLLPRQRPRRRLSRSFSFLIPKHPRIKSTRSTPIPLYSNKWPLARALIVTGDLPWPFPFLLLPSIKLPNISMAFHHDDLEL